jgi:hypothetical protein
MTLKKKRIEVALPLNRINTASAWAKFIRYVYPGTLPL